MMLLRTKEDELSAQFFTHVVASEWSNHLTRQLSVAIVNPLFVWRKTKVG